MDHGNLRKRSGDMTHDELLDTIGHWNWVEPGAINALRAVVELHQPVEVEYFDKAVCFACSPDIYTYFDYPCATIQAIEKELG